MSTSDHAMKQQRLYGHEIQQEQIVKYLHRRLQEKNIAELCVIKGLSGTGKSSLARTLVDHCDFFLLGKCYQIHKESSPSSSSSQQPFKPFVDALTQLVDQILRKDSHTIKWFKSTIQNATCELTEINLLIDMVPALNKFFPSLYNNAAAGVTTMQHPDVENPTITVVCKFLQSICSTKHRIVLVVDDVQWIDSSSLELLERIACKKDMVGFMLVATCREDEVTVDHPFSQTIQKIEQGDPNLSVKYISVENLSAEAVKKVAAEKFPTLPQPGLEALSSVLYRHTKGNAFFVSRLLQSLESSGWKVPDQQQRQEQRQIEAWDVGDNQSMLDRLVALDCDKLVDVVVAEISNKSNIMKDVLKSASCLGADFVTAHIRMIVAGSNHEILEALQLMEEQRFIIPHRGGLGWSWVHDKYQKAAYLLLDPNERRLFHLKIGRRLLANLSDDEIQEYIFILTSQFCIGLKYLEEDEKESVAKLLLRAGKRSAHSSSFGAAASYFSMGTSLLNKDNWESQYDLSLLLYNAAAEMECFRGRFDESDKLVNVIMRHARSLEDELRAYETKIYSLGIRQEVIEAGNLALEAFEKLGEKFPKKPKFSSILYEIITTKWQLLRKTEDDLMTLPTLTDWKKVAVFRVMQLVFASLIRGNPQLAAIVICRCMKFTLREGLCGMSCVAFFGMSFILIRPLGLIDEAIKCTRIGKKIMEKYGVDEIKCRCQSVLYAFCLPYKEPLRDMLEPLEAGGKMGLLTGDLDAACFCFKMRAMFGCFSGWPLQQALSVTRKCMTKCTNWNQQVHVSHLTVLVQMLENLVSTSSDNDPCIFMEGALNEDELVDKSSRTTDKSENFLFWLLKSFIAMYLGEYQRANDYMCILMKLDLSGGNAGMYLQLYFLGAMTDLCFARHKGNKKARKYKPPLSKLCSCTKLGHDNVVNKICLVEAELATMKDDRKGAMEKFATSIRYANQQGIVFEEAFAKERYALALFEWGDVTQALDFFEQSKNLYEVWGSPVKVNRLKRFVRDKTGMTNTMWT